MILRGRPLKEGYELMEASVPEDGADIARLLEGQGEMGDG